MSNHRDGSSAERRRPQTLRRRAVAAAVDDALGEAAGRPPAPGSDDRGDHSRLVAHEMRSHLAVLRGYLAMIEDGSLGQAPPAIARVIPELSSKAKAISQLVEDMLDDVRLQDGRLHLSRRLVDLREVVDSSVQSARFTLPKTHRLVHRMPSRPVLVDADSSRIGTILRNLLDNGVKYSPDGGTVECLLEAEGDHAIVRVADEGVGVDEADVPALFQRFGRARVGRGRSVDGVGLGLYISKTLAELHGGGLTYSPRAAGGSVFSLRLPLAGDQRDG